jgi:hypothetical protein
MAENIVQTPKAKNWKSKTFSYSRNVFAIIGVLGVLGFGVAFGLNSILKGIGAKTIFKAVSKADGSAKATLYQIDAGAMAATRTYVALSNAAVDGSERGDGVLTFLHLEETDGDEISLEWKTNRLLVVTYPARAEIEFAVSKTRGITIQPVSR